MIGLLGMRERAAVVGGTLDIEPTAGGGTTVLARVPLFLTESDLSRDPAPSRTAVSDAGDFGDQRRTTENLVAYRVAFAAESRNCSGR